ncbi:hypothetical protein BDN72DRAFT_904715 [Pluteus cervinus]|uniref:Uncharacterized protein n=1 Tax=Pluteus cervinus TaxID=181527 RepID=A0ACD3A4Y8_9AGAR|nr:hypothetical protein BDN72DRAFT_904715 [Pluteus cervinus]
MGFANLHGVHAHGHTRTKRDSTACSTGGITNPTNGQTVDSLKPLNITWDTSCLSTKAIDIFLYAPGMAVPRVHAWQGAAFAPGYHVVDLMPRWWNSSSTMSLQVMMIESGKPPFLSTLSGGPVFSATYTKPADGSTPAAADVSIKDNVSVTLLNDLSQPKKMNSGKTAAAVLLPLLFVSLLIGLWLKKQRTKGQDKRREWKEAVDKRMSTISTDWKAMSAAGATAAIRNSMAVNGNSNPNNRASSFSFGPLRPQSSYAVEEEGDDESSRPKSQMRTGVGLRNPMGTGVGFGAQADRQSRVSFAADTRVSRVSFADGPRPSLESRKSVGMSRAFHTAMLPPMPENAAAVAAAAKRPNGGSDDGTTESDILSPRQTTGALLLTPDEIHHRVGTGRKSEEGIHGGEESYTEVMPALRMIRTSDDNEFLFDVPPTPAPAPVHHKQARSPSYPTMPQTFSTSGHDNFDGSYPTSESPQSMSPVMSTQPIPASMMSPDEMLRAYAEKRQRGSINGGSSSTATTGFPNTMFSSATPIRQQSPSPRSSSTGGLLSSLTPKRKKSTKGMNKFGAISAPVISYPTLAAGTGPITDLGAPPVPGQRNDDPFGGPMGI